MVRVKVVREAKTCDQPLADGGWQLAFQWCRYVSQDDGACQYGYRFIWYQNGKMKPTRGQARIPSIGLMAELIDRAKSEGWGHHDGDRIDTADDGQQANATRRALLAAAARGDLQWNGGKPAGLRGVRLRGGPTISQTVIENRG